MIPPTISLNNPNPSLKFDEWHLKVPTSMMPWPRSGVRRISSNSFGYGGSNAHAVLDDAYSYLSAKGLQGVHFTTLSNWSNGSTKGHVNNEIEYRLFPLSAQDKDGIKRVKKALAAYLKEKSSNNTDIPTTFLSDLAFTLSSRRSRLQWKSFVTASTPDELLLALEDDAGTIPQYLSSRKPTLGFVFTGQGAQWPAMGIELLKIPVFETSIQAADIYLRTELGCEWSVVAELSKGKATSKVAMALYGQTLCTVLQVALVDLLRSWDIVPSRVVGHSSGEIAAAYCLGVLSREDSWKIAYFRGLLSSSLRETGVQGAMMAVGGSPETIAEIIATVAPGEVHVACVNSPQSVTVSGEVEGVDKLLEALQAKGMFARKLKVDTAYHSPHMQMVAEEYFEAIADITPQLETSPEREGCKMYSSVTGAVINDASELGPAYWVRNLVSPVQFAPAVQNLARSKDSNLDVLVEVGPHSALQGPSTQSLKAVGLSDIPYHSVLSRGSSALDTALNLAGTLFSRAYPVNFDNINQVITTSRRSKPLVDLPTYPWNHGNTYWAESRLAKEHRLREPSQSGLLGAPYPSLVAQEKIWRGQIKLTDIPWVADHKIQGTILYPAAGFIAMAVEAMLMSHTDTTKRVKMFRLREVNLTAALVVSPDSAVEYTVSLKPARTALREASGAWTEFAVSSSSDGTSLERNCVGLVLLEFEPNITEVGSVTTEANRHNASIAAYDQALRLCKTPVKSDTFYNQLDAVGLNYGPLFRCVTKVQTGPGQSCGDIDIPDVGVQGKLQRPHVIHPGTLDAVFHLAFAALKGSQGYISQAMVPKTIDEIAISAKIPYEAGARLKGFSKTDRYGFNEIRADIIMMDQDCQPVLKIVGFCCSEVGAQNKDSPDAKSVCTKLLWRPAIRLMAQLEDQKAAITKAMKAQSAEPSVSTVSAALSELIRLVHHSNPAVTISEFVTAVDSNNEPQCHILTSHTEISDVTKTAAYTVYCQDEPTEKILYEAFESAGIDGIVPIQTQKLCPDEPTGSTEKSSDIVIVPDSMFVLLGLDQLDLVIKNAKNLLADEGRLCLVLPTSETKTAETIGRANGLTQWMTFDNINANDNQALALLVGSGEPETTTRQITEEVLILQPSTPSKTVEEVALKLKQLLSSISTVTIAAWTNKTPPSSFEGKACISLLELDRSFLPGVSEEDFVRLKSLVFESKSLLWVSEIASDDPGSSMVDGLARVVRNEEPGLLFHTLHTPRHADGSLMSTTKLSKYISQVFTNASDGETEFLIQDGTIHVSRVVEDQVLNTELHGRNRYSKKSAARLSLKDAGALKLTVENPGLLDSLCYEPDDTVDTPLAEDEVEITVKATSLNFRDVVTVMGQMPGLHLGWDAAGIVRRIGSVVSSFSIGDRVVMLNPGALRTIHRAKASYCALIEDTQSFEAAASIPLVHGTAWYALIRLARVQRGQSILIHAAAGGVGQSAIQIAQHTGMEIFATVGSDAKRALLRDTYGIPDDHIFSSRDLSFVQGIRQMTKARGVDVILNSLSGEALRQTWYCIAPFGTFIEIGARDIMGNSRLDMRPLMQNASFSFFDVKRIALERSDIMADIISGTFELQKKGITRPISPLVTYPASDVETAFRLMQSGRHQGKIAISFADDTQTVQVINQQSAFGDPLRLDPEASYIIVGGFGGLGRSLATMLVENGARKLCILSRSGAKSQEAQSLVSDLQETRGVQVLAQVCDVSNAEAVRNGVTLCGEKLGPVKGVIQCAMVLRDGMFRNMSYQGWTESTRPKVQGTWNLHEALEYGNIAVDFFVILSSFTAIYGERGAANYAAGGTYQDAVAHFRRAKGLPAVTLDVGIMKDIGVLAEQGMTQGFRDWEAPYGLDEEQLLAMVKMAIAGDMSRSIPPQVLTGLATGGSAIAAEIDAPWYLDDERFSIMARTGVRTGGGAEDGKASVQASLVAADSVASGAAIILNGLVDFVAKMLHTETTEIDTDRFVHSYGIDSLVAIELVNWAMKECKSRITVFDIMAAVPITGMAKKIAANSALLEGKPPSEA